MYFTFGKFIKGITDNSFEKTQVSIPLPKSIKEKRTAEEKEWQNFFKIVCNVIKFIYYMYTFAVKDHVGSSVLKVILKKNIFPAIAEEIRVLWCSN